MALITALSGTLSPVDMFTLDGLFAGETLGAGDAGFIHTDGSVHQADGTFAITGTYAQTKFDGIVMSRKVAGDPVTLLADGSVVGNYGSGMTPGKLLYVSSTPGALSDTPIQVNDLPVAKVISSTDIKVIR